MRLKFANIGDARSGQGGPERPSLVAMTMKLWRVRMGLVLAMIPVSVALVGPILAPKDPTEFVGEPLRESYPGTLLGTDNLGRDVWSRFLNGGHSILLTALVATVVTMLVGFGLALVAGYTSRYLDEVIMRLGDVALAFPLIVLALLFLAIYGSHPWVIVLSVGLSQAPRTARVLRSAVQNVASREFVRWSESVGIPRWKTRLVDITPNVVGTLMVEVGLRLTYSIAIIAGLAFLGLGAQPPAPNWGLMINETHQALIVQPWPTMIPVAAVALLTVGVNLVTDGVAHTLRVLESGGDK